MKSRVIGAEVFFDYVESKVIKFARHLGSLKQNSFIIVISVIVVK